MKAFHKDGKAMKNKNEKESQSVKKEFTLQYQGVCWFTIVHWLNQM